MQNTSCPPCCEPELNIRQVTLFGKTLRCKGYCCAKNGGPYRPKPENLQLQLSICPTSFCPASCPFCIAYPGILRREQMDFAWLRQVLLQLRDRDIVRGVSITGGEPFLDVPRLNDLICMLFDLFGLHLEVSLNTNGMAIQRIHELEMLSYLDAIHISRHHYDESVNSRIFGIEMPDNETLKQALHAVRYSDLFVLNCILMKDYIGTPEEARRYLDFAIEMGAGKVSFITADPVNEFVRRQRVRFDGVIRKDDPQMLLTRRFQDYDLCRCQDGVYVSPEGKLIEFYGRETSALHCGYVRGLVCDAGNRLRAGFRGEILAQKTDREATS